MSMKGETKFWAVMIGKALPYVERLAWRAGDNYWTYSFYLTRRAAAQRRQKVLACCNHKEVYVRKFVLACCRKPIVVKEQKP